MKALERNQARNLRKKGWSVRSIACHIGCSKGSVSRWVRDIPLTATQIKQLKSNQDRGRAEAANHPNSPKQVWAKIRGDIIRKATEEIPRAYTPAVLKMVGIALYWAEGSKRDINQVSFSNSDPTMVALMICFFRDVCGVANSKFRGCLHIHPHLDKNRALKFWAGVSGIPLGHFHKTQVAISKASKQKRDTLPLGTFKVVVCDVRLQSRLKGWIKGLEKWIENNRAVGAIG